VSYKRKQGDKKQYKDKVRREPNKGSDRQKVKVMLRKAA
jgi:hypothetical protein